jgi:PHD/YefM family antitoxin component YafN of YafNO toxin-antitoxin module
MSRARASEVQKNFGEWHDKAYEGPVEITRYGRTTAYLVSAKLFEEMWASYRKVVGVESLTDAEMAMIQAARVETDAPFTLDDIPEIESKPVSGASGQ